MGAGARANVSLVFCVQERFGRLFDITEYSGQAISVAQAAGTIRPASVQLTWKFSESGLAESFYPLIKWG
jgi:hypothetical protein